MVTIERSKNGQFYVYAPASNGRTLFHSETITGKHNIIKNIAASLKLFGGKKVRVLDNSSKITGPTGLTVYADGSHISSNMRLKNVKVIPLRKKKLAKKKSSKRRKV